MYSLFVPCYQLQSFDLCPSSTFSGGITSSGIGLRNEHRIRNSGFRDDSARLGAEHHRQLLSNEREITTARHQDKLHV
jgi:hypothetical protein